MISQQTLPLFFLIFLIFLICGACCQAGPVPGEFCQARNLKRLILNGNQLTGKCYCFMCLLPNTIRTSCAHCVYSIHNYLTLTSPQCNGTQLIYLMIAFSYALTRKPPR